MWTYLNRTDVFRTYSWIQCICNENTIDNMMFKSLVSWQISDSLVFSSVGAAVKFFCFSAFCCSDIDILLKRLSHSLHWGWAQKTGPTCRCRRCTQLNASPLHIFIFSFSRARCSFPPNVLNHCKLSALVVIRLNGVLGREIFYFIIFLPL